jgi:hypothetical protein
MSSDSGPKANPQTVRLLCDLAVKRHDLAERAFDTLNTRLGVVFAFNSFLLPASIASLKSAMDPANLPLRGCPFVIALIVWAGALVTVTLATVIGFRTRDIKSLPNPLTLYVNFGMKEPVETDAQVIADVNDAWETITKATRTKSKCLDVAIGAVAAELVVLLVLSAIQLVR